MKIKSVGRTPKPILPGIDLTGKIRDIAASGGVSNCTAWKWKHDAGITGNHRGRPKGFNHPVYEQLTDTEWALGPVYVGRVAGVSRQAAYFAGFARGKYGSASK